MKQFDEEVVSGSILRSVWKLTWPIVLLQLINGLHQLVDHALVGHYVPSKENIANGAIGVSWQFFLVVVVFIASFIQGMVVLVARYAGQQDRQSIGRVVYQTFLSCLYINIFFLAPLGYFITPWLLETFSIPEATQAYAIPYMRILFTCSIGMFMNFLMFNMFQALGDPRTPLVLGVFSTALNIAISAMLIPGFGPFPKMEAAGAAIGTVISPVPGVIYAFSLVVRGKTVIAMPKRLGFVPDWKVIKEVMRIGLPTGIQAITLNVGGAILMVYVASLANGAAALSAYTLCYSQLFALVTWASFGLRGASAALMGQNIGAGNLERGVSAVRLAAGLGGAWSISLGVLFYLFPSELLLLFNAGEGPVKDIAVVFLQYLAISGVFLSTALAFTGGLQGAGDTVTPMVIALLTQIGLLLGQCAVYSYFDALTDNRIWSAILISHVARLLLTYIAFRGGRWRRATARVGMERG